MHLREHRELKDSDGVSILAVSDIELNATKMTPNVQPCKVEHMSSSSCLSCFQYTRSNLHNMPRIFPPIAFITVV